MIPKRSGEITKLCGESRADEGTGPAIAAKWWPNATQRWVGTKSRPLLRPLRGRRASWIDEVDLGGNPRGVEER